MSVLVVTGTGTGVGKTVVTAALAALAHARRERVAVVKPAQTGVLPGGPGDLDVIRRLAGICDTHELARFPGPLSPEAAARAAGLPPLDLCRAARQVRGLGTLNHTALTLEALAARRLPLAGLVIGSWPGKPHIAERSNLTDLASLAGASLPGVLPEGAGRLDQAAFGHLAAEGLAPSLGGRFDPAVFRETAQMRETAYGQDTQGEPKECT